MSATSSAIQTDSALRSLIAALLVLVAILPRPLLAAEIVQPSGEPDPNFPELRLWLRADAGVQDADGRGPADPQFSGSVAVWADQSARHFDLAAPQRGPYFVTRQPGAGNRPAIAFGGGRML